MTDYLSHYSEEVVMAVTEPFTGLPSKLKWLPSLAELKEALELAKYRFMPPRPARPELVSYPLGKAPGQPVLPPPRPIWPTDRKIDTGHAARVQAELEAKRQARAATGDSFPKEDPKNSGPPEAA